ncbi:MAG: hypothetical protein LBI68_04990 [Azoarcus sp.]|nr:hypothetical protein [Azoarcus sp.]
MARRRRDGRSGGGASFSCPSASPPLPPSRGSKRATPSEREARRPAGAGFQSRQYKVKISLSKLGDVERETGNLAQALDAYRKSLTLAEQLRAILGDTPQTLRDLSVSRNKVRALETQLGQPRPPIT